MEAGGKLEPVLAQSDMMSVVHVRLNDFHNKLSLFEHQLEAHGVTRCSGRWGHDPKALSLKQHCDSTLQLQMRCDAAEAKAVMATSALEAVLKRLESLEHKTSRLPELYVRLNDMHMIEECMEVCRSVIAIKESGTLFTKLESAHEMLIDMHKKLRADVDKMLENREAFEKQVVKHIDMQVAHNKLTTERIQENRTGTNEARKRANECFDAVQKKFVCIERGKVEAILEKSAAEKGKTMDEYRDALLLSNLSRG